jgi:tetratricopeptide (TPR) repeat protein
MQVRSKVMTFISFGLLSLFLFAPPLFAWTQKEPLRTGLIYRENARTLHQEALAYMHSGRYREARLYLQQAIRLNPASALSSSLYDTLGQVEEKLGHYQQAVMSYQYAIGLQPDQSLYYEHLVSLWKRAKQQDVAEQRLKAIVSLNPEDGWAYYMLALLAAEKQDWFTYTDNMRLFAKQEPRSAIRNRWCQSHPEACHPK